MFSLDVRPIALLELLYFIVERRIATPNRIKQIYSGLLLEAVPDVSKQSE